MSSIRYPKYMWLILLACVATVTVIANLFGLKALIVFVAVASLGLLMVEKKLGNKSGSEDEEE